MPKRCVVPNCKSGGRNPSKCSLFHVPKDMVTWKKWEDSIPGIIKLNLTDVVCEKHFEEKDIRRKWVKLDADGKVIAQVTYKHPQLQKLAIPSRFGVTGKENCVPFHEYAKAPDDEENIVINDVANEPSSPSGSGLEIPEVLRSPKEEPTELPVADIFCSQTLPEVPSSMEISDDISHINSPTPITGMPSPTEKSTCGIAELFATQISPDELCGYLPEGWALQNVRTTIVQKTVFTHVIMKTENNVHCPVVQKAATLNADRSLQYFVYGRHVDPRDKNLEQTLRTKEALTTILVKFRGMNICSGIGDINIHFVRPGTTYQDYIDKWRSKACSLVSKKKRCDACMKTRKCIQQRTTRLKNPSAMSRITNPSNPIDRRKLSAMRLKLRRERRQKIRALDRVKHLKRS